MLLLFIIQLLISNALTLRKDKAILFSRTTLVTLFYSNLLLFFILTLYPHQDSISLYNGLLYATISNLLITFFLLLLSLVIIFLNAFYPTTYFGKLRNNLDNEITQNINLKSFYVENRNNLYQSDLDTNTTQKEIDTTQKNTKYTGVHLKKKLDFFSENRINVYKKQSISKKNIIFYISNIFTSMKTNIKSKIFWYYITTLIILKSLIIIGKPIIYSYFNGNYIFFVLFFITICSIFLFIYLRTFFTKKKVSLIHILKMSIIKAIITHIVSHLLNVCSFNLFALFAILFSVSDVNKISGLLHMAPPSENNGNNSGNSSTNSEGTPFENPNIIYESGKRYVRDPQTGKRYAIDESGNYIFFPNPNFPDPNNSGSNSPNESGSSQNNTRERYEYYPNPGADEASVAAYEASQPDAGYRRPHSGDYGFYWGEIQHIYENHPSHILLESKRLDLERELEQKSLVDKEKNRIKIELLELDSQIKEKRRAADGLYELGHEAKDCENWKLDVKYFDQADEASSKALELTRKRDSLREKLKEYPPSSSSSSDSE